ncbi:methylmalonyl-CoA decarboxylase subunit gamma [Veillonella caviae]|uniref:methylmalonyl-CoA decarboxylase subunit gamma n=1 Tax=Veillonella caviae TaxID=248316 RepID=UPI000F8E90EB|nr:biotin/lipoyl-containing protein [Veillonella caviae]MCF0158454.1 biotin/lipoyl-binding protein [Veillonella sp.]MCI5708749.1 biotin/lipoyl-binding protein [Veillonella caviae]MCI6406472.1 biotin/lipoyl-binding protein [Veillonella caviae]MCI7693927.1 biotin/lipoyl-binding protein [Veillonella caviae]MDD7291481.1 biotin/lipoyl-binding protein [Veillonella caviae]
MKKFNVTVNGTAYEVEVNEVKAAAPAAAPKAAPAAAPAPKAAPAPAAAPAAPVPAGAETVKAPMPGKILSVAVSAGQAVKKGETLLILEAMKMQNEIAAPHDAVVAEVRVSANQTVSTGEDLVVLG